MCETTDLQEGRKAPGFPGNCWPDLRTPRARLHPGFRRSPALPGVQLRIPARRPSCLGLCQVPGSCGTEEASWLQSPRGAFSPIASAGGAWPRPGFAYRCSLTLCVATSLVGLWDPGGSQDVSPGSPRCGRGSSRLPKDPIRARTVLPLPAEPPPQMLLCGAENLPVPGAVLPSAFLEPPQLRNDNVVSDNGELVSPDTPRNTQGLGS